LLGALWHNIGLGRTLCRRPHVEDGADPQHGELLEILAMQMIELCRPVQLSSPDPAPGCRGISPDVAQIRERRNVNPPPRLECLLVCSHGLFSSRLSLPTDNLAPARDSLITRSGLLGPRGRPSRRRRDI
jgi:hypothetical protein